MTNSVRCVECGYALWDPVAPGKVSLSCRVFDDKVMAVSTARGYLIPSCHGARHVIRGDGITALDIAEETGRNPEMSLGDAYRSLAGLPPLPAASGRREGSRPQKPAKKQLTLGMEPAAEIGRGCPWPLMPFCVHRNRDRKCKKKWSLNAAAECCPYYIKLSRERIEQIIGGSVADAGDIGGVG